MSEFDLINQYFKAAAVKRDDVVLGIGDDCALLSPPPGKQLAVSTDTLISGVHFPETTKAEDIGYKSLAVNLSDLAAMGAEPAWVSLAISLPELDHAWLENFMSGFTELAQRYSVCLIGGDTTRGPLSITISVTGFVSPEAVLKRSSAKAGDAVFVTGTLGDARLGLQAILNKSMIDKNLAFCIKRLNRPTANILAGQLLGVFSDIAAIDISDGLLSDLGHICTSSETGAIINLSSLPLSNELSHYYHQKPDWQKVLNAGDDYELCFCCSQQQVSALLEKFTKHGIPITQIGKITEAKGIQCLLEDGTKLDITQDGYNHFAT